LKGPTSPRIVTSKQHSKHTWMWPIVAVSLFNIISQTCCPASFPGFLPLFLGISILSGISLSWGAPAPFHVCHTVNLCSFYFYKLIGKLTAFLHLQEFSLRNLPVDSSTSVTRCSPHISKSKWTTSSPRLQLYVST
jgi:hypothetical protein